MIEAVLKAAIQPSGERDEPGLAASPCPESALIGKTVIETQVRRVTASMGRRFCHECQQCRSCPKRQSTVCVMRAGWRKGFCYERGGLGVRTAK